MQMFLVYSCFEHILANEVCMECDMYVQGFHFCPRLVATFSRHRVDTVAL